MTIDTSPPVDLLARLAELPEPEIVRRLTNGNQIYLLKLDGEPASYGWSATGPADIGNLNLSFTVPKGERYLWDFVTLPAFRGRGLYPRLLQDILRVEMNDARWFWIGHESHNDASRRGILKAGFKLAGHIRRLPAGLEFVGTPSASAELSSGAARALGLRLAGETSQAESTPTSQQKHDNRASSPGRQGGE